MKKETLNLQTAIKLIEALSPKNSITIVIDSCNMNSLKESSITHLVSVDSATALKYLELYKRFKNATVTFLVVADMFDYATAYNAATDTPSEKNEPQYTKEQEYEMWSVHYEHTSYAFAGRRYSHQ